MVLICVEGADMVCLFDRRFRCAGRGAPLGFFKYGTGFHASQLILWYRRLSTSDLLLTSSAFQGLDSKEALRNKISSSSSYSSNL